MEATGTELTSMVAEIQMSAQSLKHVEPFLAHLDSKKKIKMKWILSNALAKCRPERATLIFLLYDLDICVQVPVTSSELLYGFLSVCC